MQTHQPVSIELQAAGKKLIYEHMVPPMLVTPNTRN